MAERRQQVEDRIQLSFDQKTQIAQKSNERCCHCGKKVYFGYGATIDHFIPIKKGGTNQMDNLIMLCDDCNQRKKSRIFPPRDYLKYLNDRPMQILEEIFSNYISRYEYLSNRCPLACDGYSVPDIDDSMPPSPFVRSHKNEDTAYMIRCYPEDREIIYKYLKRYFSRNRCGLEKYLDDFIDFYMEFGAFFYITKDEKEITDVLAVTLCKHNLERMEDPEYREIRLKSLSDKQKAVINNLLDEMGFGMDDSIIMIHVASFINNAGKHTRIKKFIEYGNNIVQRFITENNMSYLLMVNNLPYNDKIINAINSVRKVSWMQPNHWFKAMPNIVDNGKKTRNDDFFQRNYDIGIAQDRTKNHEQRFFITENKLDAFFKDRPDIVRGLGNSVLYEYAVEHTKNY